MRRVAVSELEDYTFCPRSWWFSHHPPPGAADPSRLPRAVRGVAFHQGRLSSERRRERWAGAIAAAATGSLLLLILVLVWTVSGR